MKKQSTINNQPSTISFWHPASLICTVFGVGKIPFAPGTWGSLAGVIYIIVFGVYFDSLISLNSFYGASLFIVIACGVPLFLGLFCSEYYIKRTGKKDPKEIVIDEVAGQAIAFSVAVVIGFAIFEVEIERNNDFAYVGIFYGIPFITFRIFDIVKRGPVGWIDRNVKGGLGVMLDDVVAGVMAGITSALIFYLIAII